MPAASPRAERAAKLAAARREIDRRTILDGAAALFAAHGFTGTTMAMIAARSGVALKTLYSVFASKSDLFEAVLADHFERYVSPVLSKDRSASAPAQRVLDLVDDILAAMEQDAAFLLLYARGSADRGGDPYGKYVAAVQQHVVGLIADALPATTPDRRPEELATALTASLVALAQRYVTSKPARPVTEASTVLHALFAPALRMR